MTGKWLDFLVQCFLKLRHHLCIILELGKGSFLRCLITGKIYCCLYPALIWYLPIPVMVCRIHDVIFRCIPYQAEVRDHPVYAILLHILHNI